MPELDNLDPAGIWRHFENICSRPHPSGEESRIREYVIECATAAGLDSRLDPAGNVIVAIPAGIGREKDRALILQSHLDMVPVAAPGKSHDFSQDSIEPYVDGDFVTARDTTLGADNGIGVAIQLQLMATKFDHGPLELLFTVNEEDGMTGAREVSSEYLAGRHLINLDTEEWGEIYLSCAGGFDSLINLDLERENFPGKCGAVKLEVGGLRGGHSGLDINLGRGNAIKILCEILSRSGKIGPFRIQSISGGNKRNSIPDHAETTIVIDMNLYDSFMLEVKEAFSGIKKAFSSADPGMEISISPVRDKEEMEEAPFSAESSSRILKLLLGLPNGVQAMSCAVEDLVETSVNLGVVRTNGNRVEIVTMTRSAVSSSMDEIRTRINAVSSLASAEIEGPPGYPGWEPNPNSELLNLATSVYKEMHGKEPEIKAVHAGLECGLFSERLPGIDMISIGPDIFDAHSPAERVRISSVNDIFELLLEIIRKFR